MVSRGRLRPGSTIGLETIARPSLRHTSFAAYRIAVEKHLMSGIGKHRLDRLEPEHLERLYKRMVDGGSRPATAHQVHRTARVAFGEALRRVILPGTQRSWPSRRAFKPIRLSRTPWPRCNCSSELRANVGTRRVGRSLSRSGCARERHWPCAGGTWIWRVIRFGSGRRASARSTPTAVGGDCGRPAGFCPKKRLTNSLIGETKSAAGKRVIGLPDQLVTLLREHREKQGSPPPPAAPPRPTLSSLHISSYDARHCRCRHPVTAVARYR